MILPVFQRIPSKSVLITKQRGSKQTQELLGVFLMKRKIFKTAHNIKMIKSFCPVLFVCLFQQPDLRESAVWSD